jgi:hypothetical protein
LASALEVLLPNITTVEALMFDAIISWGVLDWLVTVAGSSMLEGLNTGILYLRWKTLNDSSLERVCMWFSHMKGAARGSMLEVR